MKGLINEGKVVTSKSLDRDAGLYKDKKYEAETSVETVKVNPVTEEEKRVQAERLKAEKNPQTATSDDF